MFLFLLFQKKVRLPRTVVSRVLTGKYHGTDLSQASRIQIRANGSGCLTRDTKDIANEDQQDSPCPLTRQHVIRSNYMGKSIEAKKKVRTESWLIELDCSLNRPNYNFRIKYLMQDHVWALHAYKAHIVSSIAVRRFSFLRNRGIWSKRRKNALPDGARQAARCLSALRGCINLLLSTWCATPYQRILYSYFANTEHNI